MLVWDFSRPNIGQPMRVWDFSRPNIGQPMRVLDFSRSYIGQPTYVRDFSRPRIGWRWSAGESDSPQLLPLGRPLLGEREASLLAGVVGRLRCGPFRRQRLRGNQPTTARYADVPDVRMRLTTRKKRLGQALGFLVAAASTSSCAKVARRRVLASSKSARMGPMR